LAKFDAGKHAEQASAGAKASFEHVTFEHETAVDDGVRICGDRIVDRSAKTDTTIGDQVDHVVARFIHIGVRRGSARDPEFVVRLPAR